MAVIVNERDKLLQAAPIRVYKVTLPENIIIPGFSGIELVAPTNFFKINANGVVSPTELQITAVVRQISGVITWSVVEGTAQLTTPLGGSNTIRFLPYSTFTTQSVKVRATIVSDGVTYQDEMLITKLSDGARGNRGMANASVAMPAAGWSDTAAFNAIAAMTGGPEIIVGDTVNEYWDNLNNGVIDWTDTRFWNGGAWVVLNHYFHGNMLVAGSIGANQMGANSITAANAALADLTVTSQKVALLITSENWNGSAGWAIDKNGNAFFFNVTARGNIQADSITANTIIAGHIQGGQISVPLSTSTGGFGPITLNVTVNAGDACLFFNADPGSGGSLTQIDVHYNGVLQPMSANVITLIAPAAGLWQFTIGRNINVGSLIAKAILWRR